MAKPPVPRKRDSKLIEASASIMGRGQVLKSLCDFIRQAQ
ncbi:hypothetical protein B398_04845 [Xylella fastidiosa 32]|nr:hypothetical protein B398_04845 [Xylella fastidiosa 32]